MTARSVVSAVGEGARDSSRVEPSRPAAPARVADRAPLRVVTATWCDPATAALNPPRILIAGDQPLAREGLAALLASEPEIEVVGTASNEKEAVARSTALQADVVIMDLTMPELDGIEAAHRIKGARPRVGIVMLSSRVYGMCLHELVNDGRLGYAYLLKSASIEEIKRAVLIVAQGGFLVGRQAARQAGGSSRIERLTPREREVLCAIAQGLDNAAIATHLRLQPGTVSMHITSIYSKLEVDHEPHLNPRVAATLLSLGLLGASS